MAKTMTLVEWSQHSKDPAVKMLVNQMTKDSRSIFDKVPFTDIDTQTVRNQVYTGHSEPSFRPIGQENYAELGTTGLDDVFGHVYDLGGKHNIDKIWMKDKGRVRDPRAFEMERAKEGTLRKFNKQFILGTANDPEGFAGLDDWLAEPANSGQIRDVTSTPVFATGGIDTFIDNLHGMFDYIDGEPDLILCNRYAKMKINSALRRSNYLSNDKDQYERRITSFDGVPLIDAGTKSGNRVDDNSDAIIPVVSTDQTYLYFVKFGPEHVTGLQMEALAVEDVGYTTESDKTVYKILLHWIVGLMVTHRWSVARMKVDFGS